MDYKNHISFTFKRMQKQSLKLLSLKYIILLLVGVMIFGCGSNSGKKTRLVIWGISQGEYMVGQYAAIDAFEQAHPGVEVITSPAGRVGGPQKLMTAIVGGVPPDVMYQDRFTIGGWASHEAFMALDNFIKNDNDTTHGINPKDFYQSTWNEANYKGKVYAIPYDVDVRVLYYNKLMLRQAGFVNKEGDVVPPKTWGQLLKYNKKLTIKNDGGGFDRIGFIPLFGQSTFYLFARQNGGRFVSKDGKKCLLTSPPIVGALNWLVKYYDTIGGRASVDGFTRSFLSKADDPFLIGQVAMMVDGNWKLSNIARYKPDMNFGVAPAPVPKGEPPITWSGGFSFAIPSGAKHPKLAWEFIKWMSSPAAWEIRDRVLQRYNRSRGGAYVPSLSANKKVNKLIWEKFIVNNENLKDKYKTSLRTCIDMLSHSKYRAVTPVADKLWDQQTRAAEYATYHYLSPEKALAQSQKVIQRDLNKIHSKVKGNIVNWWFVSLFILGILFVIGIGYLYWRIRKVRFGSVTRRALFAGLFFISPWIVGFIVFMAVPIVASIVLSFTQYDVLHAARWVSFHNYSELFTSDPLFWKSLWNTTYMIVQVPMGLAIGLAIALLLNAKAKGIRIFRTLFYLPAVVPMVAMTILWMWLLQPSHGFINEALALIGIKGPTWLSSPVWSKPSIIFMNLWTAGSGMIIWLAGLQGIPHVLYESADIDGATRWQKFRHVTFPMLTPYVFFNLVMGMIGIFQIFTSAYIITNGVGGPVDSTLFYVLYLFNNAFRYYKMGYASAMAWVLFIIILIFTLVQLLLSKKWVYYEEGK